MKLISFSTGDGKIRPGVLFEERCLAIDLMAAGFDDTLAAIRAGLSAFKPEALPGYPLEKVRLHPPLANPPRVFAIGLNYRDHAAEAGLKLPAEPVVFFKLQSSIVGPGEAIRIPINTKEPDYEAEMAFVVGKGGFRISAAQWREHVYGYTILNDVSARDVQFATSQWTMSKSFPTFCPTGPAIVTADEIADPHDLGIRLSIDGVEMQNSNTRELIFKIPELIAYLSSIVELLPGDIVSTGTPPGVGMGRRPKRWLKPGESVAIAIDGLGTLENPVEAE